MALPPPPLPTLDLNFTLNLNCKETPMMDDDYPEPPPPPARCPNCNEELTDHPRPDLFFLDDPGVICDGPDGCGWWGRRQQAEELALAAEDGWDGRRGACIITEANIGTEDDCTTHDHEADEEAAWEVTIVLNVEGATPEDALAEWVACNGAENLPIAAAVRS